jgi:DNA-binding transcriptional ArsR family regulator
MGDVLTNDGLATIPDMVNGPAVGADDDVAPKAPKRVPKPAKRTPRPPSNGLPTDRCITEAAMLLKQGSEPGRMKILLLLAGGERNVGEISNAVGQSQPATSHQLSLMRHGRLIEPRRSGKNNVYSLCEAGRKLVDAFAGLLN